MKTTTFLIIVVLIFACLPNTVKAHYEIGGVNPNPTESDIRQAQETAFEHRQKSLQAVGSDPVVWLNEKIKADIAEADVISMKNKIAQRENQERMQKAAQSVGYGEYLVWQGKKKDGWCQYCGVKVGDNERSCSFCRQDLKRAKKLGT